MRCEQLIYDIWVSVTDYIYIYIPTLQAKKVSVSQPICVVNMNITHNMPPVLQVCPKPKKACFLPSKIYRNNPPVRKKETGNETYRTKGQENGKKLLEKETQVPPQGRNMWL